MKQLCDLPEEVQLKIFKLLEYDDLIMLKKTNENWFSLILKCIESKIVVINETQINCEASHFNQLYLEGKSLIAFKLNSDLHFKIKKLILVNPLFVFDLINFNCLIDFKLIAQNQFKHSGKLQFRLANLKQFYIDCANSNLNIILETPKLIDLIVRKLKINQFKIIYPNSIKNLSAYSFDEIINQMKNLECLKLEYFDHYPDFPFNKLLTFYFYSYRDLNSTIQYFQSIHLKYPNLQIYYSNIDLNSDPLQSDLQEISAIKPFHLNDRLVSIYVNCIDKTSPHIDHIKLEIQNLDVISTELIQKLIAIEELKINQITDQTKWIQLLCLPKLTKIIISSSVDQEYLNLIAKYCKFLTDLEINIEVIENGEWLMQLKCLKRFTTDFPIVFEFFKKIVMNLNHLTYIKLGKSFKFEIKCDNVECAFNETIILNASKVSFQQIIESCLFWGDLFWNSDFK